MPNLSASPKVLMVAFHFPPLAGSSGIQRTLRFVQHLPAHGWEPLVLSADARAYASTSTDLLADVPAHVPVRRAFALDTARHLALGGRYPGFLARPDRWSTWWWGAVPAGMALIRQHRPRAIWSTYPIASAHRIALTLQRLSGLPLVMDFRDPMAQEGYPADPKTWAAFNDIEQRAARQAAALVFVTPSALKMYRDRFAQLPAESFELIENGFDEESFAAAEASAARAPLVPGCITLLHSGIVYPSERDPSALFAALGRLRRQGQPGLDRLRLRFRAAVHDDLLAGLAQQHGVTDLIELCPAVPYRQALAEMLQADALLVLQGANCNEQVPAKLYEYARAARPIVGLADPVGDTAGVLRSAGCAWLAKLEDEAAVAQALQRFLAEWPAAPRERAAAPAAVRAMSRASRAGQLAALLGRVSGTVPSPSSA